MNLCRRDLFEVIRKVIGNIMPYSSLHEVERAIGKALIEYALKEADGNQTEAARMLNMQRTALVMRIKKYKAKEQLK